jgi:putative transposase
MARSRYTITDPALPHFLTCMVVEWLPLFTRPALVDIVLDTWRFQQAHQGLRLYGYVVLEQSSALSRPGPGFGEVRRWF